MPRGLPGLKFIPDPSGFDIDLSRKRLKNKDGSFSTERSFTTEMDGRFFNFPSIVEGEQLEERDALSFALQQMNQGQVFPNFKSLREAEEAARLRSLMIGLLRGGR
jgi:hypothetical protein